MKLIILMLTALLLTGAEVKSGELYSQSAILMDGESGRVLFEKNADEIMANASTTKILTCILALENGNLEDKVQVSAYAASMPDVQLNIREGEEYYLKDLLYSLMLESHNDSAVAIAEHIAGSVEKFSDMMNEKARELGCYDTNFVTPNGLDKENKNGAHGTTAYDLALIMKYCIQNPQFLEITQTKQYSFRDVQGKRSFQVNNHNALLSSYSGMLSGKTGFTGKAGYCYVGACRRDGKTYVIALLACGWPPAKTRKWSDAKKLLDFGIQNYDYFSYDEVELKHWSEQAIAVQDGQKEFTTLRFDMERESGNGSGETGSAKGILLGKGEELKVVYDIPQQLEAPVRAGEIVGWAKYCLGDEVYRCIPVVTTEDIEKIDFFWCLENILHRFCMGYEN